MVSSRDPWTSQAIMIGDLLRPPVPISTATTSYRHCSAPLSAVIDARLAGASRFVGSVRSLAEGSCRTDRRGHACSLHLGASARWRDWAGRPCHHLGFPAPPSFTAGVNSWSRFRTGPVSLFSRHLVLGWVLVRQLLAGAPGKGRPEGDGGTLRRAGRSLCARRSKCTQ